MGKYQLEYEQTSMFRESGFYDNSEVLKSLATALDDMLPGLAQQIKRFCVVTFRQQNSKMDYIEAKIRMKTD